MQQSFSHKFKSQIKLSDNIADKWGYKLDSTLYKSQVKRKKKEKDTIINQSIKPLIIQKQKVKKSQKHLSLLKQIAELQHQKKMYDKSNQQQVDIMGLMNQRIKQYNHLVDHKHIKQKNSQDTKRVLKLKDKSQAQILMEKINAKNQMIMKQQNLRGHFRLNKKINNLYRQYKNKMYNIQDTPKINFNKTITNTTKQQQPKNRIKNSQSYVRKKSLKMRNSFFNNQQKKQQNPKIQDLYGSKQLTNKGRQLDKNINNNREVLQLWKIKVQSTYSHNHIFSQQMSKQQNSEHIQQPQTQTFRVLDTEIIKKLRNKKKMQQKYISTFLDKRNRKFKKPWGNKILIKYNSVNEAKQMLQGSRKQSPVKTGYPSTRQSSQRKKQKTLYGKISSTDLNSQNSQILQSMKQEEQNNQKYYQIMCKNQKINLFLKDRKK